MAATIMGFQAGYRDHCCCFRCLVMFCFVILPAVATVVIILVFTIMVSFGIITVSTGVITPTVALEGVINV